MNFESRFHKPESDTYLLTHSVGLMPKSTVAYLQDSFLQPWQSGSEAMWSQWLDAVQQFNAQLGRLLNSNEHQFCPQSNISSGLTKVIQALPKRSDRRVILATTSDFPSAGFVLQQAEKLGYSLRLIPACEDLQSIDVWEKYLSNDVHTVFITKVLYNTNMRLPVKQICALSKQRKITSIIDVAQAVGIVPIDLNTLNADIVLGSCIKWLCGGPGAGFLWLRQALIDQLEPVDVGWFSHQNPFEFDINNFEYNQSATRFWGGTPSVSAYIAASNGIRTINDIGVQTIQRHNQRINQQIMNEVPESCISSPLNLDEKGGTLVLKFPNQDAVEARMKQRGILFDSRQYGMRLSPHIYTSDKEINLLLECLKG